jgi:PhnB protein
MAKQFLGPYINFQGRAREAMEFYQHVLGGKLSLYSSDEHGKPKPAGAGDRIMYARLEADGIVMFASDGNPKYPATAGDHIGISVGGTDSAHLHRVFDGLAEGGQVKMPLTTGPWGGTAGWLADKFGINWNVDIESE